MQLFTVRALLAREPEETLAALGVMGLAEAELFSLAQLDGLAARLDELGSAFRSMGLRFGYHNHHVEFLPVEGRVAFDYLMERTDPELVLAELDIGWLAVAGVDPVAYLERYAGRVLSCHLKDLRGGAPLRRRTTWALCRRGSWSRAQARWTSPRCCAPCRRRA